MRHSLFQLLLHVTITYFFTVETRKGTKNKKNDDKNYNQIS